MKTTQPLLLRGLSALLFSSSLAACGVAVAPNPTIAPATSIPATAVLETALPATSIPATVVLETALPATSIPATALPATSIPATVAPAPTASGNEQQLVADLVTNLTRAALRGDDGTAYLGEELLQRATAGEPLDRLLGIYANVPFIDFEVAVLPQLNPQRYTIEALYRYAGFAEQRLFAVALVDNAYKVIAVSPARGRPGPDFPGAGFVELQSTDVTRDGQPDTILYRPSTVVAQDRFNDDYLNSVAVVAEELFILDGNGSIWLRANNYGVLSHQELITSYASAQSPVAYLVALDEASGVFLSLLPLNSDGTRAGESLSVNWIGAQNAFDLINTQ